MYLLGFDIGSSSVKASLVDTISTKAVSTAQSPDSEMAIQAPQAGWAEQDPALWWHYCSLAAQKVLQQADARAQDIGAIGIAYQMHGLVAVGKDGLPLRPSIIWCDSRAVEIGNNALHQLGEAHCFGHYLNAPGNFTASKLAWVKQHEPAIFEKIWKIMLPGDYIAFCMTGEAQSTVSGLSEGILWDFKANSPAKALMDIYGFGENLLPVVVPTFGHQGKLSEKAAAALGLRAGIPVTYRAGDQPNNALSLNVLRPGEVAATGGTSGVAYGITERLEGDTLSRVNSFAHVNHRPENPRIGVLLCINGAGIQYSWLRKQVAGEGVSYTELEKMAATVPMGSEGLRILPFGNGAERLFQNQNLGAQILKVQFNRHTQAHLIRAALEGVAFSFVYGIKALKELGLDLSVVRVGNDNLFQSHIFSSTISNLLGCRIEMLRTTGATGAAIAAGVGIGLWSEAGEGLSQLEKVRVFEPDLRENAPISAVYADWVEQLEKMI